MGSAHDDGLWYAQEAARKQKATMNVHKLRAQSCAVFLATDESVAKELSASLEWAAGKIEMLQETVDQIARMRLMPDDKINRITLYGAIEVAKLHSGQPESN